MTKGEARFTKEAPDPRKLMEKPGVPLPWKQAYLQAGYKYFQEGNIKRDEAVEQKHLDKNIQKSQNYGLNANWENPQSQLGNDLGQSLLAHTLHPVISSTRTLLRPTGNPLDTFSALDINQNLVQRETHFTTQPQEGSAFRDLKNLVPRREAGQSDIEFYQTCLNKGLTESLLSSPSTAMFMRLQRECILPVNMTPAQVLATTRITPGLNPVQQKIDQLVRDVASGKMLLAVAAIDLQNHSNDLMDMETFLMTVPGGKKLAARWEILTPQQRVIELQIYDVESIHKNEKRRKGTQFSDKDPKQNSFPKNDTQSQPMMVGGGNE